MLSMVSSALLLPNLDSLSNRNARIPKRTLLTLQPRHSAASFHFTTDDEKDTDFIFRIPSTDDEDNDMNNVLTAPTSITSVTSSPNCVVSASTGTADYFSLSEVVPHFVRTPMHRSGDSFHRPEAVSIRPAKRARSTRVPRSRSLFMDSTELDNIESFDSESEVEDIERSFSLFNM